MHPYIPHLLSDIAAAHRTFIPEERSELSIEDEFESAERWLSREEPAHTFGYYCGLKPEDFPPAPQLTQKEMKIIRKAFERMMFTWNHGIDLPDNLPPAFAYKVIVDSLDMKTDIVNGGMMSFDFCTGYAPDCIFKEYCPCLKIWNRSDDDDFKMNTDQNKDSFPF